MNRRIAEDGIMIYFTHMSALLHGRFWRALVGLAFLLSTALPALASARVQASVMVPCAEAQALPGPKSGCDDHPAKALTCGLAMCAAAAVVTASPVLRDVQVGRTITFLAARPQAVVGAMLPPDPFPPRTLHSA